MSEPATSDVTRTSKGRQLVTLLAAIVVVLGVLYGAIALFAKGQGRHDADLKPLAVGGMSKMTVLDKPLTAPVDPVQGADDKPITVADMKGKVVVVNLWATWCAPCRKEMPTLAKLQSAYAGKPVVIAAVSTDRDDHLPQARAFIAANAPLAFYHATAAWAFKLTPPVQGFPTTLIFDKAGRERARIEGDADWSGPDARAVVDALLAEKG